MKKCVIAAVMLLSVAVAASAQTGCVFPSAIRVNGNVATPQQYTLNWDPVVDARAYIVEETIQEDGHSTTTQVAVDQPSVMIKHESINDVTYSYRIRAFGTRGSCETGTTVKVFGDPVLRHAIRRGIIPIAGSARGANGAVFKTYLKLEGAGLHGRVIFHPANRIASDDDPSLPYSGSTINEWDDVVAAMGQSGIGSMSVVPDENDRGQLPRATVRLYNVASNGIFGTNVEMYPAVDFLNTRVPFQRVDVPADGNFRANVGARAVLGGTLRVVSVGADGAMKALVDRNFEAGEVVFGSPEAVYGVTAGPGETLLITFSRGIVPFYTLTDNRTNDPFLYVQGADRTDLVDQYTK